MLTSMANILGIIARTAVIYIVILVGLRLAGKREVGQMTVFDLVVLLLIANAVQNAMVGPDTSLVGGIAAAVILLVMNSIIAHVRLRSPRLRNLVEGSPTVLISQGKILSPNLRHEGIDEETLEAALREHGIMKIEDVEMAVLEIDGSISIVPVGTDLKRIHRRKGILHK